MQVEAGDSGQYRCRVDYEVSPTRNTRIKLKLIGNSYWYLKGSYSAQQLNLAQ